MPKDKTLAFKPLSVLDLPVPRSQTALMQLLQLLVGRERYRYWCGGTVRKDKLAVFAEKMSKRYPLTRNARQRSYDRKRGLACVQLLVRPAVGDNVQWWLVSTSGKGGLADPVSPDAQVARHADSKAGHVVVDDYVLMYATKPLVPYKCKDGDSGVVGEPQSPERGAAHEKPSQTSTWTWKLRGDAVTALQAAVEEECARLAFGTEGASAWGLRGLLAAQRHRPLFSGVRNQVLELHRFARKQWARRRDSWLHLHPGMAERYGDAAGQLPSLKVTLTQQLPLMVRMKVYDAPPASLRSLCTSTQDE
ncbi:hypothetical protein DY262_18000 [Hydrogenophaga borbori]|uniref:Uncharacterized protein n=2 Tax=Hydrogenophaga borbori TaxID=2294117 RepID=A0A372EG22_9BURK|nr:hypothetical protein DY262_18000 [Hydrogenophaga borbori]